MFFAFGWALGIPKEPGPVSTIIEGLPKIIQKTDRLYIMFSIANMGLNDYSKELLKKCDMPFIQGVRRVFRMIHSSVEL